MRSYLVNLALKFQGVPYIWGGSNPQVGFDCSGFVIWCLQVFELLPSGDWNAHALGERFPPTDDPQPGDLVLYGKPERVTHIGFFVGAGRMLGANGGDSTTTSVQAARLRNAMVKTKPVNYRRDFVGYRSIKA